MSKGTAPRGPRSRRKRPPLPPGRARLIAFAVFVMGELFAAYANLGDHGAALKLLAILVFFPLIFAGLKALTPRRAGPVVKLVGGVLAFGVSILLPFGLGGAWLDQVREQRTVTIEKVVPGTGRNAVAFHYAVRTDRGEYFGTGADLDSHDFGVKDVGDRVEIYVDPAGVVAPQPVHAARGGGYHVLVWVSGILLAVLLVLNLIRTQPRSSPG